MKEVFGFTPDDLSVLGLSKDLKPWLEAVPTSELTFSVESTNREGTYETRHNGRHSCGCNCQAGVHEKNLCWHQKRVQVILERREARRRSMQSQTVQPELTHRDLAPLNGGGREFSLFRQ